MKLFARIENGIVAEVFATERKIADLFHPALVWVEATGQAVAEGFRHVEGVFLPPEPQPPAAPPTAAQVQAQLAALAAQVAALV